MSDTPKQPYLQVVSSNDDDDIDIEAKRADDERPPFTATSSWPDASEIEPRQRVYDHYMRGTLSATIADGGVGKTTLAITEAAAMATGRDLLGVEPVYPVKVLYWNGEESREEIERRVLATCQHYGIDAKKELTDMLYIATGDEHPLVIASAGSAGLVAGDLSELGDVLREHQIDVLILDPFVACHRVAENDNGAIDFVAKQLARLATRHVIAVEAVHHSRKPPFGGLAEIGANDARGASAFIDAVRSARVLNRMIKARRLAAERKNAEAAGLLVSVEEVGRFVEEEYSNVRENFLAAPGIHANSLASAARAAPNLQAAAVVIETKLRDIVYQILEGLSTAEQFDGLHARKGRESRPPQAPPAEQSDGGESG